MTEYYKSVGRLQADVDTWLLGLQELAEKGEPFPKETVKNFYLAARRRYGAGLRLVNACLLPHGVMITKELDVLVKLERVSS